MKDTTTRKKKRKETKKNYQWQAAARNFRRLLVCYYRLFLKLVVIDFVSTYFSLSLLETYISFFVFFLVWVSREEKWNK